MAFRGRPIWLEIFLAVLHTRGGLMAMYLLMYLAYTGLKKLTESTAKGVEHLRSKVDDKELPAVLIEKQIIHESGWHKPLHGKKTHWCDSLHVDKTICGVDAYEDIEFVDEPSLEDSCKSCMKILLRRAEGL